LVFFFHKKIKPKESVFLEKPSFLSFTRIAALLLALIAADCIVISVTGGIIDVIMTSFSIARIHFPEDTFKLGLLRGNMPLLPAAILSRVPINIVDRFIAVFVGYGLSLLWKNLMRKKSI
jgi:hypothetical protein